MRMLAEARRQIEGKELATLSMKLQIQAAVLRLFDDVIGQTAMEEQCERLCGMIEAAVGDESVLMVAKLMPGEQDIAINVSDPKSEDAQMATYEAAAEIVVEAANVLGPVAMSCKNPACALTRIVELAADKMAKTHVPCSMQKLKDALLGKQADDSTKH